MRTRRTDLPAYTVRRSSRARRARVTINDAGEAVVVLPQRAPERAAAELVAQHAGWIDRHQERHAQRGRDRAARPALGAGRALTLEGTPRPVTIEPAPPGRRRSSVQLDVHTGAITIVQAATDARPATEIMQAWLRGLARRWIAERVSELATQMGVSPARISIRDQRSRWGSASQRGTVSFNWRLVLCPPSVLDYVVIHELAHLRVRGHSPRFWSLVERFAPDAAAARRWLRENHADLRHALD